MTLLIFFGCLFIVFLDLQYSVFKVRPAQGEGSCTESPAFRCAVLSACIACLHAVSSFAANAGHSGLKWAFAPL